MTPSSWIFLSMARAVKGNEPTPVEILSTLLQLVRLG